MLFRSLKGYIYNRLSTASGPVIEMFPTDNPAPRQIPYAEIVSIAFTGADTASGNSWEAWALKKDSERRAGPIVLRPRRARAGFSSHRFPDRVCRPPD